mmetsp:Transcript_88929/g.247048  ORF Transcript_88929/g.247048 Transcript_88929/m.247048 type:complete len:257 (+) Transcript_88929:110-880(+)
MFTMPTATSFLISLLTLVGVQFSTLAAVGEDSVVTKSHQPTLAPLSRRTFNGSVLEHDWVQHWVVLFCVDWYPPCDLVQQPYRSLSEHYDRTLNNGTVFRDVVRFAIVDCAADKVLCNEQFVDEYPTVARYRRGQQAATWVGGRGKDTPKKLSEWLHKEIAAPRGQSASSALFFTKKECTMVLRVATSFAALIAMFIWAIGRGADLWLATTSRAHLEKECKSTAKAESTVEEDSSVARLARRLPRDWAVERCTLEL